VRLVARRRLVGSPLDVGRDQGGPGALLNHGTERYAHLGDTAGDPIAFDVTVRMCEGPLGVDAALRSRIWPEERALP
jgi:hypothetical protein